MGTLLASGLHNRRWQRRLCKHIINQGWNTDEMPQSDATSALHASRKLGREQARLLQLKSDV